MVNPEFKTHPHFVKLYYAWANMKQRCNSTIHNRAHRYSLRHITYDVTWEVFDNFYLDMVQGYKSGLTLERINNNRGYSKNNCCWATPRAQANNRNTNHFFTINGVTKTLAQWCSEVEIKPSTIRQRLYSYNWSIERSLGFIK